MRVADTKTIWVKFPEVHKLTSIGKDVIFYGSGCQLNFINLTTNEEQIYTANSTNFGDGIACYAGHRLLKMFAFIEHNQNPKIFIKNYPNFDEVCRFNDSTETNYIDLVFSDRSLLITLGNLPKFNVTVWNWRNMMRISVQSSGICNDNQILRCSFGSQVNIVQMGLETKNIKMWEFLSCGHESFLRQHRIDLPTYSSPFIDCLWTFEGGLFILDIKANVYALTDTYDLAKVIGYTTVGEHPVSFCWFKNGLTIAGPTVEIRHYKKCDTWSIDWTIVPPVPIKRIKSLNIMIATDIENHILKISLKQIEYIKKDNFVYKDICLIYPAGKFIVVLSDNNKLLVFKISTGEKVSEFILKEKALTMCENPIFPYLVVGYGSGIIDLISTYNPKKLIKITHFYLMKKPITHLHFHQYGRIFIAANLNYGQFFVLQGLPGGEMKIVQWFDGNQQFTDFTLIVSTNCYQIFTIPVTTDRLAGNKIIRYCLIKNKEMKIYEYIFENPDIHFSKISTIFHQNTKRVFYGISMNDRNIYEIQIKNNSTLAVIQGKIPTGHQLKGIFLKLTQKFALTWSFDGFIILRSSNFAKNIGLCLPHHRYDGGTKKALVDPYNKYLISLGFDNNLICTELINSIIEEFDGEIKPINFINKTISTKCWLEIEELKHLQIERELYQSERNSIREQINILHEELTQLYERNLKAPVNARLEIEEFYLDKQALIEKAKIAEIKQSKLEIYLDQLIIRNNQICEWLIKNCLDKIAEPSRKIMAIFDSLEVENFAILQTELALSTITKSLEELKKVEFNMNPDPFQRRISMTIETADDRIALFGSEIQQYMDLSSIQENQLNLQNYYEIYRDEQLSTNTCIEMKEIFNKEFEKIWAIKIKEIENIKEQNQRLRHIQSEIVYFESADNAVEIKDPILTHFENPETIKSVSDDEIKAKPIIRADEKIDVDVASETEMVQLDDEFYGDAIETTMKSVLETRWEDELKKDIPLPEFLANKQIGDYREDDRKALEEYEEKLRILNDERERYKQLLKAEFTKIQHVVQEITEKFNNKLKKLFLLQLKMKSIETQEQLKFNCLKFNYKRLTDQRDYIETKMIGDIKHLNIEIENLEDFINILQELLENDCRKTIRELQSREKTIQEAFKKDIQELSSVIQEYAIRIYKKRSKVVLKISANSSTVLNQLARSVITREILSTYNQEHIEFLNSLDHLDLFSAAPAGIDEPTFNMVCKHRRLRIEYEFNWRAAQINLADSQSTLNQLQRELLWKKNFLEESQNNLIKANENYVETKLNTPIQLVIQQGLVELNLTGDLEDFKDAVLIPRKDVEEINEVILKFGNRKLKQLKLGMLYDREILMAEWRHEHMKMTIGDFQEKLKDIAALKITKATQDFLENKQGPIFTVDDELKLMRITFEHMIKQQQDLGDKLQKQIKMLKEKNQKLDKQISEINIDVCEFNLLKDQQLETKEKSVIHSRMSLFIKRSNLIKQIQKNHAEILILQAELELRRLAVYPTLPYKLI